MYKSLGKLLAVSALAILFSGSANAEIFTAYLNAAQEVPTNGSTGTGFARVVLNEAAGTITFTIVFSGVSSNQVASHIHAPAPIGMNVAVAIDFGAVGGTSGTITGTRPITPTQIAQLRAHQGYVNLHTANFTGGEIRGQLGVVRPVDNDGDGRQDLSILRFPAAGTELPINYFNLNSTGGVSITRFGDAARDFPAPGDYDGDGIGDLGLYRDGATAGAQSIYWVFRSSDNTALASEWGLNGDEPCARDFDGDGRTDLATFRLGPNVGDQATFFIRESTTGLQRVVFFGSTGNGTSTFDRPVPGDYDGDGKFDVAVYRFGLNPTNTFIVLRSSDGQISFTQFGNFNTDFIVPGDYDGDGRYDFAVARTGASAASPMNWFILQSSNGMLKIQQFGISSDFPVQGDYDGDARADIAIYRQGAITGSQNTFWVSNSFDNTVSILPWGLRPDFAVARFDSR